MELNKDKAQRHAKALLEAQEAWFYDYHVEPVNLERYENALAFFTHAIELLNERPKEN